LPLDQEIQVELKNCTPGCGWRVGSGLPRIKKINKIKKTKAKTRNNFREIKKASSRSRNAPLAVDEGGHRTSENQENQENQENPSQIKKLQLLDEENQPEIEKCSPDCG